MPEAGLKESLRFYAKALKMPTFAHIEDMVQSFQPGQSLEAFTVQLLKREYELRQENQRKRRIKRARFPLLKTMEDFDLTRLEHVSRNT